MKVRITFTINDQQRLGLGAFLDDPDHWPPKKATHDQLVDYIRGLVYSQLDQEAFFCQEELDARGQS